MGFLFRDGPYPLQKFNADILVRADPPMED